MEELIRSKKELIPIPNSYHQSSQKNEKIDNINKYHENGILLDEAKQNILIKNQISKNENICTKDNAIEKADILETLDTIESKQTNTSQKYDIKKEDKNNNSGKSENLNLIKNNLNSGEANPGNNIISISQNNENQNNNSQLQKVPKGIQIPQKDENSNKVDPPIQVSSEEIKEKYYVGIDLTVIPEDEDDKRLSTMKPRNTNKFGNSQSNNSSSNIIELKTVETNESMQDKIFKITDKSTGKVYDLRNQEEMMLIQNGVSKLSTLIPLKDAKAWDSWWKKKKIANQHLFSATDKNSVNEVRDALNFSKYKELTADVNAKGLDDWTALHIAVNENYDQVLQVLLENGANIEANTSIGRTPLHLAALRGHRKISEILLSAGAKLNPQDKEGNTPLHFLSENGHAELLKMFLVKGPDISLKNNMGETALKIAANIEIRNILKEFDGSPEIDQNYDRTIKHGMLIHDGRSDVIKGYLYRMQKNVSPRTNEEKESKKDLESSFEKAKIQSNNKFIKIKEYAKKQAEKSENSIDFDPDSFNPSNLTPVYLLGKGSFGEVYLIERNIDKKQFALKVLTKKKVFSQNLVRYAKTERNVLCLTHHPFIVSLYAAFQTSDRLFMVMEYCPGGDLGKVITRERRMTEDRARIYAAEIILALEDLHKRDIIFRDLKPENVVLDPDGHAKLTDFGLSKEGVMDNVSAKSFCGSIAYLAPEMLKKSGHGKSVDWYLLGVLIYEMLTGQPPFYTNQKELLFKAIVTAPPKFPPTMSEEAKRLLSGLLNKKHTKRLGSSPSDAEEIKHDDWFKGINWNDVYEKKLIPPKPLIKNVPKTFMNIDLFNDDNPGQGRIVDWSFVVQSDAQRVSNV